ncbi:aldo/keto reductase family protein [Aspergillus undulatus]|uniref:aldo/keto reductase family protein n=1 Tax=Aspergillus undulatus TaxID=1810928 RepID=UPI003CCDD08C
MSPTVKLVFGSGTFGSDTDFEGHEPKVEALSILQAEGVKSIDTAAIYGDSEEILGRLAAYKTHTIDTKYPGGFGPTPSTKDAILAVANESFKKLQTDQVDVYYLHSPDRRIPWEEQLSAINELYEQGKIKRFGISNFLATEVDELVRIAKEKNWIAPSVYQGNYSAVARRAETELFPTLRKHNIEFYAYSPIAGGFLTKDVETLVRSAQGRWDPASMVGALYHELYNKPTMLEGLKLWETISQEVGISKVELAYRWVIHNSILSGEYGDRVIFGARNLEQLKETLALAKKGPLTPEVVQKVQKVWELVEGVAPLDNYNDGVLKLQEKGSEVVKA